MLIFKSSKSFHENGMRSLIKAGPKTVVTSTDYGQQDLGSDLTPLLIS